MTTRKKPTSLEIAQQVRVRIDEGYKRAGAFTLVSNEQPRNFPKSPKSVQHHWERHPDLHPPEHGNSLLSAYQETCLVIALMAFALINLPAPSETVRKFVWIAYQIAVSARWVSSFVKRHADILRFRKPKQLTSARSGDDQITDVENFCNSYEAFTDTHYFPAEAICNYDETVYFVDTKDDLVVDSVVRDRSNVLRPRNTAICTSLVFVNAKGETLYVAYCLRIRDGVAEVPVPDHEKGDYHRSFFYSKTGYFSQELFAQAVVQFRTVFRARHPGLH